MTKKLTWEVDKTSLVLKVTDGAKETTWKLRKSTSTESLRTILEEMQLALWEPGGPNGWAPIEPTKPMFEAGHQPDAEELAEPQVHRGYDLITEEDSRAAQAAYVAKLNQSAQWFNATEDDGYGIPIPDYDSGEIQ